MSPASLYECLAGACRRGFFFFVAAVVAFGVALPADAAKVSERTKQKREVEAERTELQKKLANLKKEINRTEAAKSSAEEALAKSESAVSEANRSLHELVQEQAAAEAKLNQLTEQYAALTAALAKQREQLAKMLRSQYINGNEDRVKLLLSGDDPNRISRELQYYGYVNKAQTKLLESLQASLTAIEANKTDAESAKQELDEIEQEAREQKAVLEKEKTKHAALLAQLSTRLASQRKQAGTLQKDDQRLGSLVEKLARLIEEQQKNEAEQEKRRREQADLARRKAREAKTAGKETEKQAPPQKVTQRNELTPEAGVQDQAFPRSFAALRGQLRLPVKGELASKFGARRSDGPPWKGLFISAPEGSDVKAVAGGRVVFADWLRGFGNLIIVDHGNQYMTIYGNNQAVLKHAGDVVKTGDVIASAGNSGGNEQSGLYFEMRFQGRAFDPLDWVVLK